MAVAAGVQGELLDTIRLAVSEAVTNIVLHAYGAGDGEVHVTAELAEDELRVLVPDDGPGIDAGPGSRGLGLGLTLMSAICPGSWSLTGPVGEPSCGCASSSGGRGDKESC